MEDSVLQEKPGLFTRVAGLFTKPEVYEEDEQVPLGGAPALQIKRSPQYTVTVRRQIASFDDALAAAHGLKRGEQQILNLAGTDMATRQKIVDFMCGVNFAQEGTWEEVGENIFLVAPITAYVEIAPATPRSNAIRN